MRRLWFAGWGVIVCCLVFAEGQEPRRDASGAGVELRIVLNGNDEPRVLMYEELFRLAVVNHTGREIRIWDPDQREGFHQFSFQFTNLRTGEKFQARKRGDVDKRYWASSEWEKDFESMTVEIAPDETYLVEVKFDRRVWSDPGWIGLPVPNSEDSFSVSAVMESSDPKGIGRDQLWVGKIESVPQTVRFISHQLDSVSDFLSYGFTEEAIRMMTADPKLISARDQHSRTPLHVAVSSGQKEMVAWLLDHGADVNAIAENRLTPLHVANDVKVVELILRKNPDLSIRSAAFGQTPFEDAAWRLYIAKEAEEKKKWGDIVKAYVDHGMKRDIVTDIYLDDLNGVKEILRVSPEYAHRFQDHYPLSLAAILGRVEICQYLIDTYHVDVNDVGGGGYPTLVEGIKHPRVVELLVRNGADLKSRVIYYGGRSGYWPIHHEATVLHHAAAEGAPETVKLLIDKGVDVFATADDDSFEGDVDKQTALEVAAIYGRADNAEAIVSHPAFAAGDAAVRQAILDKCLCRGVVHEAQSVTEGSSKLTKVLLEHGANPNATLNGASALQIAVGRLPTDNKREKSEIMEIVAELRRHGATVDLFSAVAIGDKEEIHRILQKDPQAANSLGPDGYPALFTAVSKNDRELVAELLKGGADIEIRNRSESSGDDGETALHCAAFWGHLEIAKQLIEAGADVNSKTDRGCTPLHAAARMANVNVARLLLEHGAKIDAVCHGGETPLSMCREINLKDAPLIEELFREYRARGSGGGG
ncbi:MAG: ankyrin repeat domain-containing protein [Planctomycetaceae bacterium]|nr:ankyrin repeat domain-containing protein [Planctomycetaceae bacterium]